MFEEEVRRRIHFAPAPAWVKEADFARPDLLDSSKAPWGLYTWLNDDQIRIERDKPHRYVRTIEEVVNLSALDYLANISLPFNPYYDELTIHHVRILRGKEVIEVDVARRYFVMRREQSFERLVLSGRWTFAVNLPDVRVGDIVDMALTLAGDPQCFKGEVSIPVMLQSWLWWDRRRVRLMVPRDRKLYIKPFAPGWSEPAMADLDDGWTEMSFDERHVAPCPWEDNMPGWVMPMRGFCASSLNSWHDVGDIMRSGFEGDEDAPQGLLDTIEDIRATYEDPRDRIVAVVRFVQEGVRYFAFSLGDGGFVPRTLRQIFEDRIGDCKDVSKLIAFMLQRLGIEAWPALVDTSGGHDLPNQPPRLGAFNHCIAMCRHDGKSYWFEGTLSVASGGDLEHMAQNDLGYALVLKPGGDLVRMMDRTPSLDYEVREHIRIPVKPDDVTEMRIDYIYRGEAADSVRTRLRYQSVSSYIEDRCALFTYIYGLNMCAIPEMSDDRKLNEITISTFVTTPQPWQGTGAPFERAFVSPESAFGFVLDEPSGPRLFAYDLGDVREGRLTTVIETQHKLDLPQGAKAWDFGGLKLTYSGRKTATGFEMTRTYTVKRTWLEPKEKYAVDSTYRQLMGYDRLLMIIKDKDVLTWLSMFKWRIGLWVGAAAAIAGAVWVASQA